MLYLLYINELINTLEFSEYGLCMYVKLTSPTVADNMMLVALSYTGSNAMLDICNSYSKKWRYEYNASKCSGVVFNESAQKKKETRCFKLGDNTINETRDYTQLGIICDSFLTDRWNIDNTCCKLRGTMLSLLNNGINPETSNPLTIRTLYYSCVIPKALYGS